MATTGASALASVNGIQLGYQTFGEGDPLVLLRHQRRSRARGGRHPVPRRGIGRPLADLVDNPLDGPDDEVHSGRPQPRR